MKLSIYLKKNKLSRQEFAHLLGCNAQTVWVWLRGGRPSIIRLKQIEDATNGMVTMEDFV